MLKSKHLDYRKIIKSDYPNIYGWYTDPRIMQYITGRPLTKSEILEKFRNIIDENFRERDLGWWSVHLISGGEFIGLAKLARMDATQVEIGYGLLPAYWGLGYTTEMVNTMINHIKTIPQINTLVAIVDPLNKASVKILSNFEFIQQKIENNQATYHLTINY